MTLSEFKAWFEGFTESMDGAPNEKQFERIKEKVAQITGTPIQPVVIREYYERYRPWWETTRVTYGMPTSVSLSSTVGGTFPRNSMSAGGDIDDFHRMHCLPVATNELAMHDLGKAEYQSIAA